FDAWEDRSHPDIWRQVLQSASWNTQEETCRPRANEETLPWENAVSTGTAAAYLSAEYKQHEAHTLTAPCAEACAHPCGVCNSAIFPVTAPDEAAADQSAIIAARQASAEDSAGRIPARSIFRHICRYEKTGTSAFLPHLSLMQVMERSLLRAGVALRFTEGFNPKPTLEFAQPSSVGTESLDEVFSFETFDEEETQPCSDSEALMSALNGKLPEGLCVTSLRVIRYEEKGKKPPSLMSLYAGGRYEITSYNQDITAKTLLEFSQNPALTIIKQAENRFVVDHACGENAKGFQSLLKAALGEDIRRLRIRKLMTRLKGEN
ncbi:MAG: TIGR03936 family radical SAM-associated protein, partial [Spirochaetales bacterium]|nr:TIGR03936 family radical SAM-associated protein [Spirochaetales bacterium]